MKLYNVRITIGKYDFIRYVLAVDLEKAIEKSIKYGERKAIKEGREGYVRVLGIEQATSDEIIQ